MIPIGRDWYVDPWRRTEQLRDWLTRLIPEYQVIPENIVWDGQQFYLQDKATIVNYPGHSAAIHRLLNLLSEPAPLRPTQELINGLKDLARDLPFEQARGVEVGSYIGESAEIFIASGKFTQLTCVDIWSDWAASGEALFDVRIRGLPQVTKMKMSSIEAAQCFANHSLDFVYIDADHSYLSVIADLDAWLPKVRPGGIIAGHDYNRHNKDVRRAVIQLIGTPHKVYEDSSWMKRL